MILGEVGVSNEGLSKSSCSRACQYHFQHLDHEALIREEAWAVCHVVVSTTDYLPLDTRTCACLHTHIRQVSVTLPHVCISNLT